MKARTSGPQAGFSGLSGLFWTIALFSSLVNVLMLVAPLYMLQVYDRVIPSRSQETLLALTVLMAALFGVMGVLDYVRARVAARIGTTFQQRLDARVFRANLRRAVLSSERSKPASGLRDVEAVQKLTGSPVLFAVFDMPWAPVFLIAIYSFHPYLGHFALAGMIFLVGVTVLNQLLTRKHEQDATGATLQGDAFAETIRQQGEMIQALGMREAVLARWQKLRTRAARGAARLGRPRRPVLDADQDLPLLPSVGDARPRRLRGAARRDERRRDDRRLDPDGPGAGAGRAGDRRLAAGARAPGRAGRACRSCSKPRPSRTRPPPCPARAAALEVQALTMVPPEHNKPSLRGLDLTIEPGQALGVIGVSASGKSTLARAITGVWRPYSGAVRLDGAALSHYEPDVLGSYIGYLPQDVVLFDGTVAENIARMAAEPNPTAVVAAAKKAGAHDMILDLPQGYDTLVMAGGARLSGGQKQRIGLARAFYGDPVLLVLDEPNSNLDSFGQDALNLAIRQAKAEGKAVVIMAHRPAGIAECDLILIVENGVSKAFGPRDEVLKAHVRNYAQVAGGIGQAPAPQPQVREANG